MDRGSSADRGTVAEPPPASAAVWISFAVLCLGMFMAILDVQVVATSIPTIQKAMNIAADQMSWVQTAYLIAEVIIIPLTGLLTRLLTMRWLFVIAICVFTIASGGCAASTNFPTLIAWRIVQGIAGGNLVPIVFSAVFLLFPFKQQGIATTIAGVLALLAPTVGPIVGGWITETYSWHWLFLINITPGIVAAVLAGPFLPKETPRLAEARKLDLPSLIVMACALAALVIALKEAPGRGWLSPVVLGLLGIALVDFVLFVGRTWRADYPLVRLQSLLDPGFAVGCGLTFVLGIGLFGSIYLMPVFLTVAHGYDALAIGRIMLVTGVAQLLTAPIAVELDRRLDPRLLSAFGFLLFAAGLAMSAFQTVATDYDAMFWPQIIRGVASMFCLLPPTRMALATVAPEHVADASGLFNVMRNLGGAIGLALIDTILYGRAPVLGAAMLAKAEAGDPVTLQLLNIPPSLFATLRHQPIDPGLQALIAPMIARFAFVDAMNEAWAVIAFITAASLATLVWGRPRPAVAAATLPTGPRPSVMKA